MRPVALDDIVAEPSVVGRGLLMSLVRVSVVSRHVLEAAVDFGVSRAVSAVEG